MFLVSKIVLRGPRRIAATVNFTLFIALGLYFAK